MKISSPAFENNAFIPKKYSGEGADVNPPLAVEGVPAGAKSLALIVDDPDAPAKTWVHWVVFNIPPATDSIGEASVPGDEAMNDFRRKSYGGPYPPSGIHRYFFKLYALDTKLNPGGISGKEGLEKAMKEHIIEKAELIGLYKR